MPPVTPSRFVSASHAATFPTPSGVSARAGDMFLPHYGAARRLQFLDLNGQVLIGRAHPSAALGRHVLDPRSSRLTLDVLRMSSRKSEINPNEAIP
jgi:hypothetical protein